MSDCQWKVFRLKIFGLNPWKKNTQTSNPPSKKAKHFISLCLNDVKRIYHSFRFVCRLCSAHLYYTNIWYVFIVDGKHEKYRKNIKNDYKKIWNLFNAMITCCWIFAYNIQCSVASLKELKWRWWRLKWRERGKNATKWLRKSWPLAINKFMYIQNLQDNNKENTTVLLELYTSNVPWINPFNSFRCW